jgi:hypothetical protein
VSPCTGILLLGLCLPSPGMTRESIERAGWTLTNDQPQSKDSFASTWMRWNELVLLVGVSVELGVVRLVQVNDSKSRTPNTIQTWLKANCRPNQGRWNCTIEKRRFDAARCASGWAFFPTSTAASDGGIGELCNRVAPLFTE